MLERMFKLSKESFIIIGGGLVVVFKISNIYYF